jgi:hypothetical protein
MGTWIGGAVVGFGGLLLLLSAVTAVQQKRLEQRGRRIRGRVVDVFVTKERRGSMHRPIFEFTAADGRVVRRQSAFGSGTPTHRAGDEVDLWYDPANPEKADIMGEGRWFSILVAIIGGVFAGVGALILWVSSLPI